VGPEFKPQYCKKKKKEGKSTQDKERSHKQLPITQTSTSFSTKENKNAGIKSENFISSGATLETR
jgi:hypothetical protein